MSTFNLLSYKEQPQLPTPLSTESSQRFIVLRKYWIYAVLAAGLIGVFIFGFVKAGLVGLFFTLAAALPFTVLVAITLIVISRAELPFGPRLVAAVWGGAGATTLTFAIIGFQNSAIGQSNQIDSVVVQAAIVEESAKAMILFAFLMFNRKFISTPLMGAMLGVLSGAGFAFVENVLYFANGYAQGGWDGFWQTFVARALMSFFLHAMATMFTGMFIGFAVSRRFNWWRNPFVIGAGLAAAMTTHGLWNGLASLTTDGSWNFVYIFFWLPYVAVMVTTIIIVKKVQKSKKKAFLTSSAQHGIIRLKQAQRMSDRKQRKQVYKSHPSQEVIQWEQALSFADFWKREIDALPHKPKYDKKRNKYQAKRDKELTRLAQVLEVV